jgi:hypothetical protein
MMLYVAVNTFYPGGLAWNLQNLEMQGDKDFTVIVLDAGWQADTDALLAKTSLRHVRVPYRVPPYGRRFDWGVWNSAFLIPESDDDHVLRLQAWRVLPQDGIRHLRGMLPRNLLLERHDVLEDDAAVLRSAQERREPRWHEVPCLEGHAGDWCLRVGDFVAMNGIDEVATMLDHYEDGELALRSRTAARERLLGTGCARAEGLLHALRWRGERKKWFYEHLREAGSWCCDRCDQRYPEWGNQNQELPVPEGMEEVGWRFGKRWMRCPRCRAFCVQAGDPHFTMFRLGDEYRAPIGLCGQVGRDLRLARKKARRLPLPERVEYVGRSYTDKQILFDAAPYRAGSSFCGTRWALLDDVLDTNIPPGHMLEIGCHQAGLSAYLSHRFPCNAVWAFDRFEGGLSERAGQDWALSEAYREGGMAITQDRVRQWLRERGGERVQLFAGDVREALSESLSPGIALAIIDLNLYAPTLHALRWAWPRLAPDGWILCDDVDFSGVRAALGDAGYPYESRAGMGVLHKGKT